MSQGAEECLRDLSPELPRNTSIQRTRGLVPRCRQASMQRDPKAPDLGHPASVVQVLAGAILTSFCKEDQVTRLPDEVIQYLREGLGTCPQEASLALASALLSRFVFETQSIDDCEEAITLLDNLVASTPPGDGADSYRARASEMIALLSLARSIFHPDPEYSEDAIFRCRSALSFSSLDNRLRIVLNQALAIHAGQRFKYFGPIGEAGSLNQEIISPSSSGEEVSVLYASRRALPIATMVEKIQHLEELLLTTPTESLHHRTCLEDLACWYDAKFSRTGNISDIEMTIRYRRMLLTPPHSAHPLMFISLGFLCDDLLIAFDRTRSMHYLEESIILHRDLLAIQDARALHFTVIRRLVLSLCVLFRLLGRRQDLDEVMSLFPMAVDDRYASVVDRFKFSCFWASLAQHFRHPSVSLAYESAMSLLQPFLTFGPTVRVQLGRLVEMGSTCERMPLDYASFHVESGRLEQAVETLERGKALLWSEIRGFRTSVDQPISSHLLLEEQFAAVNHELEVLTLSATVTQGGDADAEDGGAGDREGSRMDPFCRLVTKQRKLLKERDALISHLGNSVASPAFETLRSAASRGPVIIVNHSRWRSDILILLRDSAPSHISTPSNFYGRANRLKDQLLDARRGLDDVVGLTEYASIVRSVLVELYEIVGQPVLERLRELRIPEQSRVWWCPTSVFCFLPLHAMGPIPSRDKVERYFSDIYIPSYTPTLSALIGSRKPGSPTLGKPSLLLVAHHEQNLRGVQKELKALQGLRHARVKSLTAQNATADAVIEGLQHHRFAHIVGSVKLEPGRPLDAPFRLHEGDLLTLLDIARCRLPAAEFAFLSASHTAELTDESIPDEALHLTAAMQHCGFRSVVGTMWGMADLDGKDLCKRFYKLMFTKKRGREDVPYHERAAGALRDAVQKLRKKKGMTVDRWVTYVHYGA